MYFSATTIITINNLGIVSLIFFDQNSDSQDKYLLILLSDLMRKRRYDFFQKENQFKVKGK